MKGRFGKEMIDRDHVYGAVFGFLKGLLFLILSEYMLSIYVDANYRNSLVAAVVYAVVINTAFAFLLFQKKPRVSAVYWIGQLVYCACILLGILNLFSVHITVFHHRELYFADGFVIPSFTLFSFFLVEILQIGNISVYALMKK